jgi:hypothetical protein
MSHDHTRDVDGSTVNVDPDPTPPSGMPRPKGAPDRFDVELMPRLEGDDTSFVDEQRVEEAWLPKLGPTALLLARRLCRGHYVDRYEVDVLARDLGVSAPRLWAAVLRLERCGHASINRDASPPIVRLRTAWRTSWPVR